jgi:hypothetical protein
MIDNGTEQIDIKTASRNLLYAVFRRLNKIILFLIFWIFLAAFLFFMQRNDYKISYYISSEYMSGQKIKLILTDIKNLIEQDKHGELSALLNVSEADIRKIKSFKVTTEEPDMMLSSNVNPSASFFFNETNTEIKISLKDSLNVNGLVDALNRFLSGSNYFKKIRKNEQVIVDMVNKNLEDQKKVLDSINQINISKFINPSSNIIFANDISEIKRNIYSIEERLINNKRGLVRIEDPVNLVNYPVLTKYSFLEAMLFSLLKSFILAVAGWLIWFGWITLRHHYRRFKATA